MFSALPDFTPRDSHSLWYTSSRTPFPPPTSHDVAHCPEAAAGHSQGPGPPRSRSHVVERTVLARLATDEQFLHRRKVSVQNFGSSWLRPPGVSKTLHQMREERREQEEHQEALRREQLAQELAEAEAEAMPDAGLMEDVQLDGAQDLDDDIPDADDDFGLGADDDEDDGDDGAGLQDRPEDEAEGAADEALGRTLREERQNGLMAARMRITDDAFREALVRGGHSVDDLYGVEEELEGENQGQLLDETDFASARDEEVASLGMDANLDDDIPEAENGGYEHTDSEEDYASSSSGRGGGSSSSSTNIGREQDMGAPGVYHDSDVGFAPRAAPLGPPPSPTLRPRLAQASRRPSDVFSQEGSAQEPSPAQGRRAHRG